MFFYMIPVAFVQGLTSMQSLSEKIPGFKAIVDSSPFIRGFLEGFLPTLALKIFFAILPMVCLGMQSIKVIDYIFQCLLILTYTSLFSIGHG